MRPDAIRRTPWRAALLLLPVAAAAAGGPLQGHGFILPPPAAGWTVDSDRPDAIAFSSHPGPAVRVPDVAPYGLTAGAQAYRDAALARAIDADPQAAARAWLGRRLQAPRRDIVALAVRPAALHGARCAAYDAVQVDRHDPERITPDHVEDREFAQHGMLCAHPSIAGLVVQVFYNERFLRGRAPAARTAERDARAFFDGVRWTAP